VPGGSKWAAKLRTGALFSIFIKSQGLKDGGDSEKRREEVFENLRRGGVGGNWHRRWNTFLGGCLPRAVNQRSRRGPSALKDGDKNSTVHERFGKGRPNNRDTGRKGENITEPHPSSRWGTLEWRIY